MEFDYEGFHLNYEAIAKNKKALAVTRLLATDLMTNGYINVGNFIREMSDADLKALTHNAEDDAENQYEDLMLVSEMLATGEGCECSNSDEQFEERTNQLLNYLVIESLHRKGLVKCYHENLSFNEDMGDKIVVEKI